MSAFNDTVSWFTRIRTTVLPVGLMALLCISAVQAFAQDDLGVCRSAAFWGKHSGDDTNNSINVSQTLLDDAGPLWICGMQISNTELGAQGSALEAMCISPTAEDEYQLIRELTATGLNCLMNGYGSDCGVGSLADLFAACDAECSSTGRSFIVEDCIFRLECLSDGGYVAFDGSGAPFCATGECDDGSPCGRGTRCAVGTCSPSVGCDDEDLCNDVYCFDPLGPPGSPRLCHEAVKNGVPNRPPVADAGLDQPAEVGDIVHLDGSGSWDPDGDLLTFWWTLSVVPDGSSAVLDDPSAVGPSFDVDVPGTYLAELVVNDGEIASAPDTVAITTEPGNTQPVADAGLDQTAEIGDIVQLDGSDSFDVDNDQLTYLWSFDSVPNGSAAVIDDPTSVTPTFVTDLAGDFVIRLVVNDGLEDSEPDWVTISGNTQPVADAGPDQTVETGDTVQLDGSGSTDVDGDALTYDWSMTVLPDGSAAALDDPTSITPNFVVDVTGTYVAQLIVNDGHTNSEADTVTIAGDSRPVADAGNDQTVETGEVVQLDGSGSYDADGDPLSYSWALTAVPAGSAAFLDDPGSVDPTFQTDLVGTYVAQLIVNDGVFASIPDTVTVVTVPDNTRPVADAGDDQQVVVESTVVLDGSGSWDDDGDPLTYAWSLTVVPTGSLAALDDPTAVDPSFVAELAGEYLAQLIVHDGTDASDPDTVLIEAFVLASLNLSPEPLDLLTLSDGELTVTMDVPAGAGGAEIQLESLEPSVATVPASVDIAEGDDSASFTVTAGPVAGEATIVASATAMNPALSTVHVASRTLALGLPDGALVGVGRTAVLTVTLDQPAPDGGAVITVDSDDPAILAVAASGSIAIAAGETGGAIDVTGAAVGTTTVRASAAGFDEAALAVGVTANLIGLPETLAVPMGQEVSIAITIQPDAAPPGGLEVTLTSDDPVVDVVTPTVTIPEGASAASGTLRGVTPGPASIRASAPGYSGYTCLATTTAELDILETSVIVLDTIPNDVSVQLETGGAVTPAPPGGVVFTLTADDTTCVAPTSATIPAGSSQIAVDLSYGGSAPLPCTTVVTASGEGLTPDTVGVTVKEATITVLSPAGTATDGFDVGAGLQDRYDFYANLSATEHGGVTMTISSSDSSLALVAPDDTTPGSPSIDIVIPDGQSQVAFVVQGMEGVTGNPVITASASGFSSDTLGVDIIQPALDLYYLATTIDTLDPDDPFYVRVGTPYTTTGISRLQEARAGGGGLTATVSNSNASAAELVTTGLTGQSVTVTIAEGTYRSPTAVDTGGVALSPLTPGTTIVSAAILGFITTTNGAPTVTVTSPTIAVLSPAGTATDGFDVGAGLQDRYDFYANLSATEHGGVTMTISSSDSSLALVAPDDTTPGSPSIDIVIPDGQYQASFVVQGMEGVTGNPVMTASAPGFSSDTLGVDIIPPALDLYYLATTIDILDPDDPFYVRVGTPYTSTGISRLQEARAGGGGLTATVSNSNASAAELVTTGLTGQSVTVTIVESTYRSPTTVDTGGVALSPLAPGTTDVTGTIPGFITTTNGSQTVTVTGP